MESGLRVMSGNDDNPPVDEPRSVILAVISAKNDLANQIVLKMAKEADPAGQRTMGKFIAFLSLPRYLWKSPVRADALPAN